MKVDSSSSRQKLIPADVSGAIIGAFFEVYNELGFGFLESIYARALEIVLRQKGLQVDREYPIVVHFKNQPIGFHRADMLVEKRVIVERKATEAACRGDKAAAPKLSDGAAPGFGPAASFWTD